MHDKTPLPSKDGGGSFTPSCLRSTPAARHAV